MPKRATLLRWTPPVVWMAVIFTASSLTGTELSGVSAYSFFGHLGEYAILGALLFIAARPRWPGKKTPAVFAVLVASAYGVTDELHQFLTPGRTPDPRDWATDTLGALVGVLLVLAVEALLRRRRG